MTWLAAWLLLLSASACGRFGFDAPDSGAAQPDGAVDASAATDAGGGDGRIHAPDAAAEDASGAEDAARPPRPNLVFFTSTKHSAGFGDLSNADAICQELADDVELGGSFVAVLATTDADAASRLGGSRGWVNLDGVVIGDDPASLVLETINPVRTDERGMDVDPDDGWAWLGNRTSNCTDWSNAALPGQALLANAYMSFESESFHPCDQMARFVCAEVGNVHPLSAPMESGRLGFVTSTTWQPFLGIDDADALCQFDADAAELPGTYRAFLATSTAPPGARFDGAGEPWRRPDGVRITRVAADMLLDPPVVVWDSWFGMLATGDWASSARVYIGSPTANCNDWSDAGASAAVGTSRSALTQRALSLFPAGSCGGGHRVLCLQE